MVDIIRIGIMEFLINYKLIFRLLPICLLVSIKNNRIAMTVTF